MGAKGGITKFSSLHEWCSACIKLFVMCAEFLIIIIKLNSDIFKRRFEVIIIIKLRFDVIGLSV
jgi:hypothetical protein